MNSKETQVLILDDRAKWFLPKLQNVNLKFFEQFEEIDGELQRQIGAFERHHPDLIFLDSMFDRAKRGWRSFLPRLRRRFPNAVVYLMSELRFSNIDEEFEMDWKNWNEIVALENLINTDSRISFFPKPSEEELRGWIEGIIEDFRRHEAQKMELTNLLLKASLLSYSALLKASLQDLCRAHFSDRKPVDPPYGFDIAVEEVIRKEFAHRVHEFGLILATEEEGIQNQIYRKLKEARFFLFSDPLDGSSALRKFLKPFADSELDLRTFLKSEFARTDVSTSWVRDHAGPIDFYSPTISMSLAETDQVVSSVLINVFTGKLYLSANRGNFVLDLSSDEGKAILQAVNEGTDEIGISIQIDDGNIAIRTQTQGDTNPERGRASLSGKPFTFQTAGEGQSGYVLTQLKAKQLLNEAQATISYEHFARNIQPLIKPLIDVDSSLQLRYVRNDFSPGPGRVLFLSDLFHPEKCELFIGNEEFKKDMVELLGDPAREVLEHYRLILANGEPVTEWIHWFAFVQNDPNRSLVAYRLNRPADSRWKDDVKASMAPPEVSSAFKSGYFDIRTLYSAFLDGMHRYTDTIVICRTADTEMVKLLESGGFYDSASKGVGVRIEAALDELSRQMKSAKIPPNKLDASVAIIKALQAETEINPSINEVLVLDPIRLRLRDKLAELRASLEDVSENDRALQIFIFVSRLFERWIHPVFKRVQPAP